MHLGPGSLGGIRRVLVSPYFVALFLKSSVAGATQRFFLLLQDAWTITCVLSGCLACELLVYHYL